jgi:indolepyruvate ferredoxin oxidoreductase beta subunit
MGKTIKQQILISGLGGQGVLFITSLLAEAAINKGLAVFTSETHGMAQRGGTVVSHFKVGDFSSPLIRPFQADGLVVLKDENFAQHLSFLKKGGWAVVNSDRNLSLAKSTAATGVDADRLAQEISSPKSVNLVVLGYALARADQKTGDGINLFCSLTDIETVLRIKFGRRKQMLDASLLALETGYKELKK